MFSFILFICLKYSWGSKGKSMFNGIRNCKTFPKSGCKVKWSESLSVLSDSLLLHGICSPLNSPGQNTGVGSLSLLQGIFPTQGLNPGLLHYCQILYQLSHKGSPRILSWVAYPFSSRSSQPRNWTGVSCIAGGFFTNWAIREAQKWLYHFTFPTEKHGGSAGYTSLPIFSLVRVFKFSHSRGCVGTSCYDLNLHFFIWLRAPQVAQLSRICLQSNRHSRWGFDHWVGKIPRREAGSPL